MITLSELNIVSEQVAFEKLEQCCASKTWINKVIESRPFSTEEELINKAGAIWFNDCVANDYLEAFTGHPKIGDVNSLKEKFAHTAEWAQNEQAKVEEATTATIEALAKANKEYEEKFGYIFIVSASGKSADEMLTDYQRKTQK